MRSFRRDISYYVDSLDTLVEEFAEFMTPYIKLKVSTKNRAHVYISMQDVDVVSSKMVGTLVMMRGKVLDHNGVFHMSDLTDDAKDTLISLGVYKLLQGEA